MVIYLFCKIHTNLHLDRNPCNLVLFFAIQCYFSKQYQVLLLSFLRESKIRKTVITTTDKQRQTTELSH